MQTDTTVTGASWLLLLRWVAVIGQLVTITVVRYVLRVELPMTPLLSVIGITAFSNLVFAVWVHRLRAKETQSASSQRPWAFERPTCLAWIMALDLMLLSGLLYFAGGMTNPFSIFYLVNLTLGAVLLSERWGWILTFIAVVGMAVVMFNHVNIPNLSAVGTALPTRSSVTLEEFGRVAAMAACALVIIHFVSRVTRQLEYTAKELRRVERARSRNEKLEALGTLAGGAAHELATPLSTIAVVAKEMIRDLQDVDVPISVRDDAALIRSQVDQCQAILQRMTGRAGQWMVEQYVPMNVQELVQYTLSELNPPDPPVVCQLPHGSDGVLVHVPRESTAQALRGLIQNAIDASGADRSVRLSADWDDQRIRLRIQDDGPGMPDDVLRRAGEPFFTTKEPGRGMGLGIFLTRSVVERLGGQLTLESESGKGVTACVELPRMEPNDTTH